jgi:hypothetical protein
VIDEERALGMYEFAFSVVEAKGTPVTLGLSTYKEYRAGNLTIHYLPKAGHLSVWFHRKVLGVNRAGGGTLRVTHYVAGDWEDQLEAAAAKLPSER